MRGRDLAGAPRGDGQHVLMVPGLGVTDRSLAPLRAFLRAYGHDAVGWGRGVNVGRVEDDVPGVIELAEHGFAVSSRKIVLIGWSMGGVIAREVARDRPDLIAQVITFATPVNGARHTVTALKFGEERVRQFEEALAERGERPIQVPLIAFHSPTDGVVDWRTCIDEATPGAENIEVRSTHFGMGLDPDVWKIVAQRLAPN
jgi:pimeloyl-ACP methyl ester carboxylesterase